MIFPDKSRFLATTFALAAFLAAPQADAQEGPSAPNAVTGTEEARPAMWKVSDKDTTIYLFGTIHILPQNVNWLQGPVETAFKSADLLVTETRLDKPEELQKLFVEKGLRHDGLSLRNALPFEQREKLEKYLTSLKLEVNSFDHFEAWYAGLLLSLLPLKAAGYDQANGIETQIDTLAKSSDVARHPLETAEYQIGLFASLPQKSQQAYLAEVLDQLPTLQEDVTKVVAAWKAGKAEELARLLNEDESDETLRKVLITDRNAAWAKWLEGRLAQPGVVFVAVGAGHLAGAGSVQDQLARAGIRSERVQ